VIVQSTKIEEADQPFAALSGNTTGLVETEQDFQGLAGRLLSLYDEERRSIARELHDTTAQNLAALSMQLTMLSGAMQDTARAQAILTECECLTGQCIREVRSLSFTLHPPLLDELGLETALRVFLNLYERQAGITVSLILPGQIGRLDPVVELAAFRIAQESLFNVQRHSGSKQAEVYLSRQDGTFEVAVRDWGKGIKPDAEVNDSVGIPEMRERVRLLGGQLEICQVDPGTVVRAKFPLEL
jgi:two-component system NarL family sensor kinase